MLKEVATRKKRENDSVEVKAMLSTTPAHRIGRPARSTGAEPCFALPQRRAQLSLTLIFSIILITTSTFPAYSETFFPGFYLSRNASNANQGFLQPHLRGRSVYPSIVAEINSVSLEVGETVLIPVFSETRNGWPLPIIWTLRNRMASVVSATIDRARPSSRNGIGYGSAGFRFSYTSNLEGPRISIPVQNGLGCERRFYLGNPHIFKDGKFQSLRNARHSSIYLCVHGREVGKAQILVGEAFPDQEITRQIYQNIALLRPLYLSQFSRSRIDVEIIEPTPKTSRRNELSMIDISSPNCDDQRCEIHVAPLNRGGERLSCSMNSEDNITVHWQYSKQIYKQVSESDCKLVVKPKRLPSSREPAFDRRFQVGTTAMQTRVYSYAVPGHNRTVNAKVAKQAFGVLFLHPVRSNAGKSIGWARALCPMIVAPGSFFSCLISVVDEMGQPPTSPYHVDENRWTLPRGITFHKLAKSYACFKVSKSALDSVTDGIKGMLTNSTVFSSGRIVIEDGYKDFLKNEVPPLCM